MTARAPERPGKRPRPRPRPLRALGKAMLLVGRAATHDWTPRRSLGRRAPLPDWIRDFVLWRDRNRCAKCAASDELEIHHRRSVLDGGTDHPDNLATLCARCHGEWTFNGDQYEELGVLFEEWLDLPPARVLAYMVHACRDKFTEVRLSWAITREERWCRT